MKKLLEELQKLDADCYEEIWAWVLWLADPEYGDYDENDPGYLKHRDDVIVGCVGRAIAAKGWFLTQSQDCRGKSFIATIGEIQGDDISFEWKEESDSPAKAVLSSYLSAIGSQP